MEIAILQPKIPHYRSDFFEELSKRHNVDLYTWETEKKIKNEGFAVSKIKTHIISSIEWKGIVIYDFLNILFKKHYDVLVLPLHFAHLSTWIILLLKFAFRCKIILWGHGISVKRYLKEENKPDWKLKLMIYLSNGIWTYMQKETDQWKKIFPNKSIVSLDNTLSGTDMMVNYMSNLSKLELKHKYGIKEGTILIFCARFESNNRRTDLLIDVIERLDKEKFGFIIIGAGRDKPNFSSLKNVYDFGALYDTSIKQELFSIADIYFQPGWCGLSIVEAMAYGKPIFTFVRTEEVKQCVEYSYIKDGVNGKTFENVANCVEYIEIASKEEILQMGENARNLVKEKLLSPMMADKALSIL